LRRKDRELSYKEALEILDNCEYAVISCIDEDGEIFSVPISPVREGESIFIHGAVAGSKARLLKDGRAVELVCVSSNRVPKWDADYADVMMAQGKAASLFTTEFKSAVAKTAAYLVAEPADKIRALKILSEKYTPQIMRHFDAAIEQSLKITNVYELKIKSVSAKAKVIKEGKAR